MRERDYVSVLAPWIRGLLQEKRAMGYAYRNEEKILSQFDRWWNETHEFESSMTRETLEEWCMRKPSEGISSQAHRISAVRELARYRSGMGEDCWIPDMHIRCPRPVIHVLTRQEVREFFVALDEWAPGQSSSFGTRMNEEYKVLFRLYASAGLRNSEGVSLRVQDVDLSRGAVTILGGKCRKDRVVFLAPDMLELLHNWILRRSKFPDTETSPWLFPGRIPSIHVNESTAGAHFQRCWLKTASSWHCEKAPTLHSLRHTYVVMRINAWIREGHDLSVMMPYLAQFLGHAGPGETFYYFHQIDDALDIIRNVDSSSASVIPEVMKP